MSLCNLGILNWTIISLFIKKILKIIQILLIDMVMNMINTSSTR